MKTTNVICLQCNKEFGKSNIFIRTSKRHFCSRECYFQYTKDNVNKYYCKQCHTETKNPKFCSRSCAAAFNNKLFVKRLSQKIKSYCTVCNKIIRKGNICNLCKRKLNIENLQHITLRDIKYDRKDGGKYALIRWYARSIVKDLPKVCTFCGYKKHVEICHIKAIKDFDLDTKIVDINSKDNLILLCPNCHWEMDHGLIDPGGTAPPSTG